jgi:hypothetical protein
MKIGYWVFSDSCGITININGELQAIFYGQAWSRHYQHVKCEFDCQLALKLIKEWAYNPPSFMRLLLILSRGLLIIFDFCPFIIHWGLCKLASKIQSKFEWYLDLLESVYSSSSNFSTYKFHGNYLF